MGSGAKGVVSIVGGTAAGQLLVLATAPVITRLFTPEAFGVFSVISATAMIIASVMALRLELAIPLPSNEGEAKGLAKLCFIAIFALTAISCVTIWFVRAPFADVLGQPPDSPWLWWVPLLASLIASFAVLNQLAVRQQRYGAIGRRNFLQQGATAGFQTAFGASSSGSLGLVIGAVLGQAVGVLSLLPGARSSGLRTPLGERRIPARQLLNRYRRFPLLLTPAALLNNAGQQAPLILMAGLFGAQVAGWLGLTTRVLAIPMSLCGLAIAQVFLSTLARTVRTSDHRADVLFWRTTRRLAALALLVLITVIILGPDLFALVFGREWEESGQYARALALAVGTQLIASPLSQTLIVLERQVLQLAWDCGRLLLVCLAIVVPARLGADALTTLWIFSAASSISYAASWLLSWWSIRSIMRPRSGVVLDD